ncbi:MAG: NADH-quinone oxidoreductase subunit L [Candidatus Thermoplasmatota archaeon]|jgi:NADH-quinone oxidoreductase subunit L|nr:NADH-quinone oxidoreductase subunit L [Candidatus Thermoplasmatota archaeon]MCL5787594.1 NADH-quinone oxidoreductase subunit L [Candidatus Thermoplasmatota archaeon]
MIDYEWFIFLSPIIAFPISFTVGRYRRNLAGYIATISILISFILSFIVYLQIRGTSSPVYQSFNWFGDINAGIYIDHLALVMILMVSFVSLMIHLFALYYMGKDPNKHVYFAETALFTGGMLGLSVSSNLVEFFLFWELVGVCSYLLIGFWYFKPNASSAAKKAFIVTRVGDLLFLIGLSILYVSLADKVASPLSIAYIVNPSSWPQILNYVGTTNLTLIGLLFMGGAAGKSAQFPLHVWIPDAMEGPTTVSALIHAATMVTAGVYLVARVYPIYLHSTAALDFVLFIGAFTALFAGTIGMVVNDLKRILAYSTISQLGYMFAALGIGSIIGDSAISFALFHTMVHAVFKALLFLAAGAILLTMMELRDVKKMGGLWKRMPITMTLMFIGAITLSALPFTASYYSKDTIIDASWNFFSANGYSLFSFLPWLMLILGALTTTIYTFRFFFLAALGKPRSELASKAKDPSKIVLIPLIILAIIALIMGQFQYLFYDFIYAQTIHVSIPYIVSLAPSMMVLLGLLITIPLYATSGWMSLDLKKSRLYRVVKNKYYLDKLFTNDIAERGIIPLSSGFSTFETYFSRSIEAIGSGTLRLGSFFRRLQNGIIEYYFVVLVIGISIILLIVELLGGF